MTLSLSGLSILITTFVTLSTSYAQTTNETTTENRLDYVQCKIEEMGSPDEIFEIGTGTVRRHPFLNVKLKKKFLRFSFLDYPSALSITVSTSANFALRHPDRIATWLSDLKANGKTSLFVDGVFIQCEHKN